MSEFIRLRRIQFAQTKEVQQRRLIYVVRLRRTFVNQVLNESKVISKENLR